MRKFIRFIFNFGYWLTALFIVLSILAKYVPPSKYWFVAFIAYLLPFWCILLFIQLVLRRNRKRWKISIVFILIGIYGLRNNYDLVGSNSDESDFKILSYNVRLFDYYNWLNRKTWDKWSPRTDEGAVLDSIYSSIKNKNADVLCFQEYFNQSVGDYRTEDYFQRKLDYKYVHKKVTFKEGVDEYGIATFSKFPILKRKNYGFGVKSNNGILATDIALPNDTIRVLNVHLLSYRFNKSDYQYFRELSENPIDGNDLQKSKNVITRLKDGFTRRSVQLNKLLTIIETSPYPVVLAGDFNEIPNSYLYKKISDRLIDSFDAHGLGVGATHIDNSNVLRIDYIFHNSEYQPTSHKVFREELSDHYPLLVGLKKVK